MVGRGLVLHFTSAQSAQHPGPSDKPGTKGVPLKAEPPWGQGLEPTLPAPFLLGVYVTPCPLLRAF